MRSLIFLVIVILTLGGCGTSKPTQLTKTTTVKDSIWTEVQKVKRDTTITIPGATTYIRIPVYELTEVPVTKTSGRSTASIRKVGNNIEVQCECAKYKAKIQFLETIISQYQKIQELTENTIIVPEKFVPWWVKIFAWLGGIALAFGIGLLVIKVIKPF